jgi:hypothetical protein
MAFGENIHVFFGVYHVFSLLLSCIFGLIALKKTCRQIYDSQNILRTFSKIDRIQNIIHINI